MFLILILLPSDKIFVGTLRSETSFVGVIRVLWRRSYAEKERIKFSLDFSAFGDELRREEC